MIFCYAWAAPAMYRKGAMGYADFSVLYTAGRIVRAGQGHCLYDLKTQTQVQKQFSHAAVLRNAALPYMRPPFEAVLFLPFVHFPYPQAYLAWSGLNLLLVMLAALLARGRVSALGAIPAWVYYAAYLAFFPLCLGLELGQDVGIILLLFVALTACLVAGQDFWAGCVLGLGLIKFHLILPLVFVLLLKRRSRALGGFALMGLLLAGLSALVVGGHGLAEYPVYLWRLNQAPAAAAISRGMMPNLRGLLQGWGSSIRPYPGLDLATAGLSVMLLLWAARRWDAEAPGSKTYLGGFMLVLLASVLSAYHVFVSDLSLLCPMLLVSGLEAWGNSQLKRGTRGMLAGAAGALLCAPVYLIAIQMSGRLNLMAVFLLVLAAGWGRAIREERATPPVVPAQA
jgi:hypothetical protein